MTMLRRTLLPLTAMACAALVGAATPALAAGPALTSVSWASLSGDQKRALKPLADRWAQMQPEQQRKWLAVSANYKQLPPHEQERLQDRMEEWADLSNSQRMEARRNFGTARKDLSADERKAKWDEFNNLDSDQRKALKPKTTPVRSTAPAARTQPLTVTLPEKR